MSRREFTSRRGRNMTLDSAKTTMQEHMTEFRGQISKSGVRVADDFRDNLIIDRYDPVFIRMRASKVKHLRSENSEDAVTWNVFRSLRQIEPGVWLPDLVRRALPGQPALPVEATTVSLWLRVKPPAGLLAQADEGPSEIDVVLESPSWAWFIEAKYRSDISSGTTTRPLRDQVLRNVDVGSCYAGVRSFFFSLLVESAERSPVGAETVARYQDLSVPRSLLSGHRPDGLMNLKAVTLISWADLGAVLMTAAQTVARSDEAGYAKRAIEWMKLKGLVVAV
jgi:hypothetical protein